MKLIAQVISWLALVALMLPSLLFLFGAMDNLDAVKLIMLIATVIWFVAAALWIGRSEEAAGSA
ncbi:MAG: hypothetical protein IT445_09010 [Phycisphaeraceae bacterium]|nr:hypothetical protein [Phycisphaeraceae bacterium]